MLLLAVFVCVVSGHAAECALWKGRASLLCPAFVERFQAANGGFYRDTNRTVPSNYWYAPHALHAVVRASYLGILNKTQQQQFLPKFYDFHESEGWTTPYIDDVSWMIEELVYSLPLVVDDVALTERLWTRLNELSLFVFSSWDTSCCISRSPGGAWWDLGHTYKATASNAGAVNALAAVYFGGNGNQTLLLRAQLIFEFWRLNQVLESGQVLDGIRRDGTADGRIFTYNEGMMLRAIASLSKTNAAYNDYAAPILRFLLENETFPNGVLKEQHPCQEDDMDCQEFKGITFRYLIDLIRAGGVEPELRQPLFRTLEMSVESIWNNTNGTALPNNWEGPPPRADLPLMLSSQTAALNAILAWTDYVCGGEQGNSTSTTGPTPTTPATTAESLVTSTNPGVFATIPPTSIVTSPPSFALATWQVVVSVLMAAVIVFVIGGVVVVLCLRRRNRAARSGELVVAEGFATDQEDNEDLFEDL